MERDLCGDSPVGGLGNIKAPHTQPYSPERAQVSIVVHNEDALRSRFEPPIESRHNGRLCKNHDVSRKRT
jgi:hypothetical protein